MGDNRCSPHPQDTDVIVWDVINESGLYRLRGHKDAVTRALFLKGRNLLITRYGGALRDLGPHTYTSGFRQCFVCRDCMEAAVSLQQSNMLNQIELSL